MNSLEYEVGVLLKRLVSIESERRDIENQVLDEMRLLRRALLRVFLEPASFTIREITSIGEIKMTNVKATVDLKILDDGKGVLYTLTPVNAVGAAVPLPPGVTVAATSSAPASLTVGPNPGDATGLQFLGTVPQPPVDADGVVVTFSAQLPDGATITASADPVDITPDNSPVGFTITETAE